MSTHTNEITGWLHGRLPDAWFTGPAEVTVDREEILVLGTLAAPEGVEGDPDGPEITEAAHGRISRFREDTRDERIAIAREAEHRFGRKIAWGAECGPVRGVFTNLAVPVMTRLRQRAHRAGHPGRGRGRPQPRGRPGLVRPTGR